MKKHGYSDLPSHCFWPASVAGVAPDQVDPVVRAKFKLSRNHKIATAGSCFAQHISNFLKGIGFQYLVTEPAQPMLADEALARQFNYGVFTARYGNVYTARQWLQLLRRAYGEFDPREPPWPGVDGRAIDPFRPQIQPQGFRSVAELEADRTQHHAAVRRAVEELDVLVFTLGLTEAWVNRRTGAVYPLCPGVAGGRFDESEHVFHNFRVAEVVQDLNKAFDYVRARNSRARFILTVSPVPLVATAENRSVVTATSYSKAVLRLAAEEVASRPDVDYFPAYEIVTGPFARGAYFEPDLRSITPAALLHVMRLFLRHYAEVEIVLNDAPASPAPEGGEARAQYERLAGAARAICEEELLASP